MELSEPSILTSLVDEKEATSNPTQKIKNKQNNKSAGLARKNNAKTKSEMMLESTITSLSELNNKQMQLQDANKKKNNFNFVLDKMGTFSVDDIYSEQGFNAVKQLLPSLDQETYYNSLVPSALRRRSLTRQLQAIPIGTNLSKQMRKELSDAGIDEPQKYMRLTTLRPNNTILGAIQRTAMSQAADPQAPLSAYGKDLQSREVELASANQRILESELPTQNGVSNVRKQDLIVNRRGEPDPDGEFIGSFTLDEKGNPSNFIGLKKASKKGEDLLIKGRQQSNTIEISKRKEKANKIQLETDEIKRQREISQDKIKKMINRKIEIDSKELPKIQSQINELIPIENAIVKLNRIIAALETSGQLGAVKGRLAEWINELAPDSPILAEFNTIKSVITPFTARSLAKNVGTQSDRDIQLIERALPMLKGTQEYNEKIISSLLGMIVDRKDALINNMEAFKKVSKNLEVSSAPRFKTLEAANKANLPKGTIIYVFHNGKYTRARVD